jgi:hypothetical protein
MDDQKQQLIEKLQSATNILVTVSANPSVDQLAACIGLTVALNKMDKHATAVFSGEIPETIEFLKPEETLEKNTDSLRDFMIALDKTKADKLRYKVEDKVVKIFITPYKTSISEDDLNFSQGDFNVDAVVALGVREQQDLDQAITSHGRILHDATVLGIHNQAGSELGNINWVDTHASSLSELSASLIRQLDKKLMDEQIATALLTGIVASTDRFRNEHTSAQTMSISADLMAAGANQQLVTSELEHTVSLHDDVEKPNDKPGKQADKETKKSQPETGTLEIDHQASTNEGPSQDTTFDSATFDSHEPQTAELPAVSEQPDRPAEPSHADERRDVMTEPPRFNSPLTANDKQEVAPFQPSADLTSTGNDEKLLTHNEITPPSQAADIPPPPMPSTLEPAAPHAPSVSPVTAPSEPAAAAPDTSASTNVEAARSEVMKALSEQPDETLPPIVALNAQPLGDTLHDQPPTPPTPQQPPAHVTPQPPAPIAPDVPPASHSPADQPLDMPLPPSGPTLNPPQTSPPTNAPTTTGNGAMPPPVPPPMTPPSWPGPQQ